jgi:hypothetical protein
MLRHHGLSDPALERLGKVVHEADIEDERYDAPEAAGLEAIVRGMGLLMTDEQLLAATVPLYDGLLRRVSDRNA